MALFGIESGAQAGCREALTAARVMSGRMGERNASLHSELDRQLRNGISIGIGIHAGPIIIGEMGYGGATAMTAIGDAVNTASRIEELTKEFGVELVVSEAVVTRAGLDLSKFPRHEVETRRKREMLAVRTLSSAAQLPASAASVRNAEKAGADWAG